MVETRAYALTVSSPLGALWLCVTERGLCRVTCAAQPGEATLRRLAQRGIASPQAGGHTFLERAATQLREYFAGERRYFTLPLDLRGTAFQRVVWAVLLTIPYGATTTYGDVARMAGSSRAARAVGQAVGANPVAIIVPCHRVLGYDGALTGYGGGLDRKVALLQLEGVLLRERPPEKSVVSSQ